MLPSSKIANTINITWHWLSFHQTNHIFTRSDYNFHFRFHCLHYHRLQPIANVFNIYYCFTNPTNSSPGHFHFHCFCHYNFHCVSHYPIQPKANVINIKDCFNNPTFYSPGDISTFTFTVFANAIFIFTTVTIINAINDTIALNGNDF